MINRVHAYIHRPEHGWDPVPAQYAQQYAQTVWQQMDEALVETLAERIGGMEGKKSWTLGVVLVSFPLLLPGGVPWSHGST